MNLYTTLCGLRYNYINNMPTQNGKFNGIGVEVLNGGAKNLSMLCLNEESEIRICRLNEENVWKLWT